MSTTDYSPADFARVASELHASPDAEMTAERIVQLLAELVSDAGPVSMTVRAGKRYTTVASTDELASRADALQYETGEGPCLDAADDDASWLRSGDVGADERWPAWGPRAAEAGVGSLLSVRLLGNGGPQGALNVYSRRTGQFTDRDLIDQVLIYAVHATHALAAAQQSEGLTTALTSRHLIGMAQGILMERYGLSQAQSFALLRRLSTTSNTKLRDIAAEIVTTRRLPGSEVEHAEGPADDVPAGPAPA